jgi:hypothetical protein
MVFTVALRNDWPIIHFISSSLKFHCSAVWRTSSSVKARFLSLMTPSTIALDIQFRRD